MINPGVTRNGTQLPTSSGGVSNSTQDMLSRKLVAFDGFSLTLGMVLALVLFFLIWQTFFAGRRRR